MTRSLIVLPDDSAEPILAAIEGAVQISLRVKMFVFSDPRFGARSLRRSDAASTSVSCSIRPDALASAITTPRAARSNAPALPSGDGQPAVRADAREVDGGWTNRSRPL